MTTKLGQDVMPTLVQIRICESFTTGCSISYRRIALRMLSDSFSFSNLAEWQPMTTNSLGYFFSRVFRSGRTCMQLMQQYVQKSTITIFPLRSFSSIGPAVFSQPVPPSNRSAGILILRGRGYCVVRGMRFAGRLVTQRREDTQQN